MKFVFTLASFNLNAQLRDLREDLLLVEFVAAHRLIKTHAWALRLLATFYISF